METRAFLFHKEDDTVKTKENYDKNYRKVEAIYRKGYSNDHICAAMSHLPRFEVLEMIQNIFATDKMRSERNR